MRLIHPLSLLIVTTGLFLAGCKKSDRPSPYHVIKSFAFTFAQNAGLSGDVAGVITDDTIKVGVPQGTDLQHLIPTISYVGANLSPASGVATDFSTPVRYTVTAQDGGSRSYLVKVQHQSPDKLF